MSISKVITVWGAAGSGKTTVSVNLAAAIAERGLMVALISANPYYGEFQTFFGKRVEPTKGIYRAILKDCNTKNMFESTKNDNLFFLSIPNEFDGMLLTAVSGDTARELIEDSAMRFDYVVIDGKEDLNNPISSMGLAMSGSVVEVHRVSAKGCLWNTSMKNTKNLLRLDDKTVHILNGYDKTCDKLAYISSCGIKFDFELPYVENARILENSGRLIYGTKVGTGSYRKIIDRLASQLITGGGKLE